MYCIKLLGDKLSAKHFSSQVNEMHARIAVLNKFTELGRQYTQIAVYLFVYIRRKLLILRVMLIR